MESDLVFIEAEPDKRSNSVCHNCGSVAQRVHSCNKSMVRDLNMRMHSYESLGLRPSSAVPAGSSDAIGVGLVVEDLGLAEPSARVIPPVGVTQYILDLCQSLTIISCLRTQRLSFLPKAGPPLAEKKKNPN